mgnify:CR=1 FL=1
MSKGVFTHIVVSIIYSLLVLFVLNGESTNMVIRLNIALFFTLIHVLTAGVLFIGNDGKDYKEKI